MKIFVGIILGFFSGFLTYTAAAALFVMSSKPSVAFVFVTFVGGWGFATWVMARGARTISQVFSRGFLIGAAEWLAMIPASLVLNGKILMKNVGQGGGTDAELVGATISAGSIWFLTSGVAVVMALACLIGFAIVNHLTPKDGAC